MKGKADWSKPSDKALSGGDEEPKRHWKKGVDGGKTSTKTGGGAQVLPMGKASIKEKNPFYLFT